MNGNERGISGIDTIGACIGATVGALLVGTVVLLVFAAKWMIHPVLASLRAGWRSGPVAPSSVMLAGDLAAPAPATVVGMNPVLTAGPACAADRIKVIELRGGEALLHLRFYDVAAELRPQLVLREQSLVARHGARMYLAPISLAGTSAREAEEEAVRRAQALVVNEVAVENSAEQPIYTAGSIDQPEENYPDDLVEQTQAMPAPEVRPKRKPRKGLVSYKGALRRACVERRTDVREPYDCFCVTLADEALGEDQQLWGTDLRRAVDDAGVAPGDVVRISVVGETPVFHKGQSSVKKIWAVEKVAA